MDLSKYTLQELLALQKNLPAEIERRKAADKKTLMDDLHQRAAVAGFSLTELLGGAAKGGAKKVASIGVAKYRNPADASQTWSGRGRKPLWVVDHLAAGGELDALSI